jgi:hypothetical protein
VLQPPKDWTSAEEALSRLARVASDRRPDTAAADFSAGPRVAEPSLDATLRPVDLNKDPLQTDRPSHGRRALRSLARFLAMTCIGVAGTLAWQYSGTAREMIASWAPQLGWSLSLPAINRPADREIAIDQPSPPAVQESAPQAASAQAAAVAPTASETAASTAPTGPSPELQQLETMARDLAAVRHSIEQLTAGQEQMARDIAKLQTAGQDIRRRISALPPPATAAPARNPVPLPQPAPALSAAPLPPPPAAAPARNPVPPPQPAPQSSAVPLPPALPEPPSRPPLPVR